MATLRKLSKGWRYTKHSGNFRKALQFEDFQCNLNSSQNVLVQMQASPLTQFDLDQIRGVSHVRSTLPAVAGSSGVGVVIETNSKKGFQSGDRVVLTSHLPGSWATEQAVSDSQLLKVPNNIPLEYASLFTLGPLLAHRILKSASLEKGDGILVNGANTVLGLSVLQLAKHYGLNAVGVMRSFGEDELQLEKLKQMGLNVVADPIVNASQMFGSRLPKLAIDTVGGYSAAHLLESLGDSAHFISVGGDIGPINYALLAEKGITLQGLSPFTSNKSNLNEAAAEVAELINNNKFKLFVLRHPLANLFNGIEDLNGASQVVLMHEGNEKTWENKSRDEYMKIDEKLQQSWDNSAAAQEPYLKAGREQPWTLSSSSLSNPDQIAKLDPKLQAQLKAVTNEEQFVKFLDGLSPADKKALGMGQDGPVKITSSELKDLLKNLQKN